MGKDSGSDAPPPQVDAGTGTITGSADGSPFTIVAQSLWLGAPDDPATTVIYLFSKPVACSDLASPGWDTRITNATQFLEVKMFGTKPGMTFPVVTTLTPAPGEASVNYTLSSQTGTPNEMSSSGGTASLDAIESQTVASGTFDLKFGTNSVKGSYVASFCLGGHEP